MGCGICLVSADEFEKQFTRAIRKAALRALRCFAASKNRL